MSKIPTSLLAVWLLLSPLTFAQELPVLPEFESLSELEAALGRDLPDDFDYTNVGELPPPLLFELISRLSGAPEPQTSTEPPADTLNCFDYYTFGSVDIQIFNPSQTTLPGVPITFTTELTNNNQYPLVDGALYVKIFRGQTDNIATQINGDHIVDAFYALEEVTLKGGGTHEAAFTWTPPRELPPGQYYAAGYFSTANRFNLAGLSFTDDIIGGKGIFNVVSDEAGLYFAKDAVTLDGNEHQFIAAAPRLSETEPIPITATIKNDADEDRVAMIRWDVYSWDALQQQNLIESKEEAVSVPANGEADIAYSVTDDRYAVYLVIPTITYNNEVYSKLDIRFVRNNKDHLRINFPSLLDYPLKAGEETSIFSCLHNGGTSAVVPGGQLKLTLTDELKNVIHQYVYTGSVTGDMMGVASEFVPEKDYSNLILTAELLHNGLVVEAVTMDYRCEDLDPTLCPAVTSQSDDDEPFNFTLFFAVMAGLLLLIAAAIGVLTFLSGRAPKTPEVAMTNDNQPQA